MLQHYVADRRSALDALRLIDDFGAAASEQAGDRARASRDGGNVVMFCRWRQIERLVEAMQPGDVASTRH